MNPKRTPQTVTKALVTIGEDISTWRKLRRLTVAELADRADVSPVTIYHLEKGQGSTLESLLRVARALGVLELITSAANPYNSDVGRLRADDILPERVRRRPG
jgi:transcriptional regulator with XRE-family HTH domain